MMIVISRLWPEGDWNRKPNLTNYRRAQNVIIHWHLAWPVSEITSAAQNLYTPIGASKYNILFLLVLLEVQLHPS